MSCITCIFLLDIVRAAKDGALNVSWVKSWTAFSPPQRSITELFFICLSHRTTTEEEREDKYVRLLAASLEALNLFFSLMPRDQHEPMFDKYRSILKNSKFWKFVKHPTGMVKLLCYVAVNCNGRFYLSCSFFCEAMLLEFDSCCWQMVLVCRFPFAVFIVSVVRAGQMLNFLKVVTVLAMLTRNYWQFIDGHK